MPKIRQEKEQLVLTLTDALRGMTAAVFADFRGLKVKDITALRRECRQAGLHYTVVKKTILKLAAKQAGLEFEPRAIEGSFATVLSTTDEVAPAKILAAFAKKHEALKILGGLLERRLIDSAAVINLSSLPSREELLAKLIGSVRSPVAGLVQVLAGNLRGLVQTLQAIGELRKQ